MRTLAVILAGGRSSRMGRDKAGLPFGNGTMLSHLTEVYRQNFDVAVSVGEAGRFPVGEALELVDLRPGQGPLAGLETAFRRTEAETVFLTATDLPFGDQALALELVRRLGDGDACVIRRRDGGMEPLFGVYRRSCLSAAEACLDEGRRSCRALLERVDVRWAEEADLPGWDLDRVLQNVNTPEEYALLFLKEK